MKIKELIEFLKTLDQDARVFLQYDSYDWYELQQSNFEHPNNDDLEYYREAEELGVKKTDYKIEMG